MIDPWYRAIDISYGPDGGVFISDWTDTGDYHNRTGENRLSGRIYKITYGDAKRSSGSDMTRLTVEQLIALNTHANEWFPRQARVELPIAWSTAAASATRSHCCAISSAVRPTSRENFARCGRSIPSAALTNRSCLPLLESTDEHLRAWGIRLLSDHWPIDALLTPDGSTVNAIWTQQRPAPSVGGAEVTHSARRHC